MGNKTIVFIPRPVPLDDIIDFVKLRFPVSWVRDDTLVSTDSVLQTERDKVMNIRMDWEGFAYGMRVMDVYVNAKPTCMDTGGIMGVRQRGTGLELGHGKEAERIMLAVVKWFGGYFLATETDGVWKKAAPAAKRWFIRDVFAPWEYVK